MSENPIKGDDRRYGAIEAGGTKFLCAVGDVDGLILDQARIETRDPATTVADVCRYFGGAAQKFGAMTGLGVGAFGPLDLKPESATFGFITNTPKPGWKNIDLAGALRRALGRPVSLDTDVNAAALGELQWGAGRHLESLAYVTVGTGIGVGVVHHGRPVHGLVHPERPRVRHRHRRPHRPHAVGSTARRLHMGHRGRLSWAAVRAAGVESFAAANCDGRGCDA